MAALVAGDPPGKVAADYGVAPRTVRGWRDELRGQGTAVVSHEKKVDLGVLLSDYLTDILTTLAAQARFTRDESWLRQQNAGDLALLHGVYVDKVVRILAALETSPDAHERVIDLVVDADVPQLPDGEPGAAP